MPRGHWCVPVLSAARHSAGGAEERNAPQPEGIDGPRRAQRRLKLKRIISTIALMKVLHQKKTGYFGFQHQQNFINHHLNYVKPGGLIPRTFVKN